MTFEVCEMFDDPSEEYFGEVNDRGFNCETLEMAIEHAQDLVCEEGEFSNAYVFAKGVVELGKEYFRCGDCYEN